MIVKGPSPGGWPLSLEKRQETFALDIIGDGNSRKIEDGGSVIDVLDKGVNVIGLPPEGSGGVDLGH